MYSGVELVSTRPHRPRACRTALTALVLAAWVWPAAAQAPPAVELLGAADRYLAEFIGRFSNVVAEERYAQWTVNELERRELVSDFLIVQIPATNDWVSFRDVLEVDGEPVGDGGQRLLTLLLEESSASTLERARAIATEGARFNLAGLGSLNEPLLALAFVQGAFSPRFAWTVEGKAPAVGPDVWEVRFAETARPTLVRGAGNGDAPAAGAVWIEALTGRILQTTLRVGDSEVLVRFAADPAFGIAVPVDMRETHFAGNTIVRAAATYGRFRSFNVQTSESFDAPPESRDSE